MLNITITGSSPATECDRCDAEYKKENGCSLGRTSTEIMLAEWSAPNTGNRDICGIKEVIV